MTWYSEEEMYVHYNAPEPEELINEHFCMVNRIICLMNIDKSLRRIANTLEEMKKEEE